MKFEDPLPNIPIIDMCYIPDIIDKTTKLAHLQKQIRDQKQEVIFILIALLKSIPLNNRDKTLYITLMTFPTLFPIRVVSFNSSREMIIKLTNYHLHLICY